MKKYPVEFEIAGPAAMFARPDTGAAPVSYPVPTWSSCKAIFESVARGLFGKGNPPAAFFCPTEVEIWRPVRFERYVTNYRGPLRKSNQIEKNASYQLQATMLVDVCYRVKGCCVRIPEIPDFTGNAPHALQDMFNRRLRQGASKYAPCLGWKEFLPSYFGPFREHAQDAIDSPELQSDMNLALPGFLLSVWDTPTNGSYQPIFCEGQVRSGVLAFPIAKVQSGKLIFEESPSC